VIIGKRSPFREIFMEVWGADPGVTSESSRPIMMKLTESKGPHEPPKYREPDDIDANELVLMLNATFNAEKTNGPITLRDHGQYEVSLEGPLMLIWG
jgi:hypothetical protein